MSTTKTIVIDEVAAHQALRKTVEKYGKNHRAERCTYSQPEVGWLEYLDHRNAEDRASIPITTGCILGAALHDVIGVPLETLKLMDSSVSGKYHPAYSEEIRDPSELARLNASGYDLTPTALDVFEVAQKVQDNGGEWGYALAKAEAYAELLRNGEQNDGTEGAGATA